MHSPNRQYATLTDVRTSLTPCLQDTHILLPMHSLTVAYTGVRGQEHVRSCKMRCYVQCVFLSIYESYCSVRNITSCSLAQNILRWLQGRLVSQVTVWKQTPAGSFCPLFFYDFSYEYMGASVVQSVSLEKAREKLAGCSSAVPK